MQNRAQMKESKCAKDILKLKAPVCPNMPVFDTLFRMSSNRIRLRKNTSSLSCLKSKSNSLGTAYAQLFIF